MRLARAVLTVAATALTPALLLTTPAFATGTTGSANPGVTASTDGSATPADETEDRVAVFRILHIAQQNDDRAVIREATAALDAGTPEALRAFLETGYPRAQFEDDMVATFRILHIAQQNDDRAVIREATAALDAGTPDAVREFRETGYRLAQFEDDRVAVFRILADPTISDALRTAAEQALDNATPESLRYFLEHGRYEVEA